LSGFSSRMLYIVTDCQPGDTADGPDKTNEDVLKELGKHFADADPTCKSVTDDAPKPGCPAEENPCDYDVNTCACGVDCYNSGTGHGANSPKYNPPATGRLLETVIDSDIFKSEEVAGLPAAIQGERPWQPLPMLACFVAGLLVNRLVGKISRSKRDERQSTSLETSLGEE